MGPITSILNKLLVDLHWTNLDFPKASTSTSIAIPAGIWQRPQKGFMKLNTDGSWKSPDKAAGGAVIRRDNGR